jgi:aminoglycoside/choline kinase family phosphotransferase
VTDHPLSHIARLTAERFPQYAADTLVLEPLEKGGSDRKFYRVKVEAEESLIFVQYGRLREENKHYVEIGAFLEEAGVRVPKMLRHEEAEGRIWMEDLGDTDLWAFRRQPWSERRPLYEATLREVRRLHTAARRLPHGVSALGLQASFDEALYAWEQQYFFTHCLGRHLGVKPASGVERLADIAVELAGLPRLLVHRDFQSQNIVIKAGAPCLIDFQGMRFGLPQYDLASLLLDPYVYLSAEEQEALLSFYVGLMRGEGEDVDEREFERVYWLCAAQRLMQALGAYGFLGHERGRADFLAHIPVALPRLLAVWARLDGLQGLAQLTAEAARRAGLRTGPDGGTY